MEFFPTFLSRHKRHPEKHSPYATFVMKLKDTPPPPREQKRLKKRWINKTKVADLYTEMRIYTSSLSKLAKTVLIYTKYKDNGDCGV